MYRMKGFDGFWFLGCLTTLCGLVFLCNAQQCEPCNQPLTSQTMVDHFCSEDTEIVMRATVKRVRQLEGDLAVELRPWKKILRHINLSEEEAQRLDVVIKGGAGCSCDMIERRKKYLLMGKVEDGRIVVSYVSRTNRSTAEYREGMRVILKQGSCIYRAIFNVQNLARSLF